MNADQAAQAASLRLTVRPTWSSTTAHWIMDSVDGYRAKLVTRGGILLYADRRLLVLTGKSEERVRASRPDLVDLFGIGTEAKAKEACNE